LLDEINLKREKERQKKNKSLISAILPKSGEDEIAEKKKMMEMELGHSIQVVSVSHSVGGSKGDTRLGEEKSKSLLPALLPQMNKEESEILEMKKLMENELGHTVRVGSSVDGIHHSHASDTEKEIEEKMRLMEEELGQPIIVRRGKAAKGAKMKREEEIRRQKELMELVLGEGVAVQQIHVEEC
jgi:hypothetical protein